MEEELEAKSPSIQPRPNNLVCPECGSAEVECLDWVRVNDNYFIGGNETMPADDYWCPHCEAHAKPIYSRDYCAKSGHTGSPCCVCAHEPR